MSATLPQLLTPMDVGLWLSIPTGRVIRMAKGGQLPCLTLPNGDLLFDQADLLAWLEHRRQPVSVNSDREKEAV